MLLRSSSTPILGSLLSSSSHFLSGDSPASLHHHHVQVTCHMSPVFSDSSPSRSSLIRRTCSDGNLPSLLTDHSDSRSSSRKSNLTLETINSILDEEMEESYESEENNNQINSFLEEGGNSAMALPPLFLARGLGIDRLGSGLLSSGGGFCGGDGNGKGGRGGGGCSVTTGDGRDRSDLEMYYKKMVQENPSNPLFLRNYAMFLHQVKFDFQRAEEYYSRAILLDPNDGETLSKYASLVWELHRDEERAASYFDQAVKASPQDSFVHAAQAGFLWDTDDSENSNEQDTSHFNDYTGFTNQLGEMTPIAT